MPSSLLNKKVSFGTAPVFFTAISTILGAILFLRLGWGLGQLGFIGIIGIIALGHLITIPTTLAVAEIATNQKVQGGGAYYIISRSFGLNIGGSIGIALYISQAISVAFYIIAFAEAWDPVIIWLRDQTGFLLPKRVISLSTMAILSAVMLTRGARIGMKALYAVVAILFISIFLFFIGSPDHAPDAFILNSHVAQPASFFYVFTILFPAFTGLAAGLGLSGDLKNPKKAIPRGTIWATLLGMVVYAGVAYKLSISAVPEDLNSDQLIMQRIALWGPIIPIGLAAATLSSALGSILVAPRTLQAIGVDRILPNQRANRWMAFGRQGSNEPVNASIITILIACFFIAVGDINFVAGIISMFFIMTYGAICLISFLEHLAADPSYRPTFRSKWYLSLVGAILSFWAMFRMNPLYAFLALVLMGMIYYYITAKNKQKQGLANLFRGVMFQISRQLQILVQRADQGDSEFNWRPFVVCISRDSFKRRSAFDLIKWLSYKYGFGTYMHYIKGYLNADTHRESREVLSRLLALTQAARSKVYLDTIISPSYTSAIAQMIQIQGISGKGNNMILLEFSRDDPGDFPEVIRNFGLFKSTHFDVCILNTSIKGFGYYREIHVWITSQDYENANLMILLAFILLGHPDWKKGVIKIFALYPEEQMKRQRYQLMQLIRAGRLPISPENIELIRFDPEKSEKRIISEKSMDADFIITGFRTSDVQEGLGFFADWGDLNNILFVNADRQKEIK